MSLKSRFDLVIFDWAGTMVDFGCTAPVSALIEAFSAAGVVIDGPIARRDMGKAKIDHVRSLLAYPEVAAAWRVRHGLPPGERDVEVLIARLGPLMREYAGRASTLIPGARAMVERLRAAGLRRAGRVAARPGRQGRRRQGRNRRRQGRGRVYRWRGVGK